eukprot:742375-Karenia_brevis.AAC.1
MQGPETAVEDSKPSPKRPSLTPSPGRGKRSRCTSPDSSSSSSEVSEADRAGGEHQAMIAPDEKDDK